MTQVSVRNVVKRFGAVAALDSVSLDVGDGEVVALLGPSGCGKTTTLRSIAGLETPTAGEIHVSGRKVFGDGKVLVPTERRGIGMVFQSYALWPHLTVFENVAYGLRFNKSDAAKIPARVREVLSIVGMAHLEERLPSELSGGQQQRVAVARALAPAPAILLFDEPLSNLDQKLRERMRLELRALQQRLGYSGVYVTHDRVEAMVTADRILVMNVGKVVEEGKPQNLYRRPKHLFTAHFLGDLNRFEGTVLSHRDGGLVEVETPLGRLTAQGAENSFKAGQAVIVGARPEAIHLTPGTADDGVLHPATIADSVFLGERLQVEVRIGGRTLKALALEGNAQLSPGAAATVTIAPSQVLLFDAKEQSEIPEEDV